MMNGEEIGVKHELCQIRVELEDCGGAPGYEDVLKAIRKPNSKRHAELREWIGPGFDPLAFSVDEVNRKLSGLSRRSG